jgi:transcription termination/antitermination protein NusA
MAMVTEFIAAINQICSERGIPAEKVFQALEEAVLAAFLKEKEQESGFKVEMDRDTGVFRVISVREVVEKVEDAETQITLKEAKKLNKALELGDTVEQEQEIAEFGRIAAQTAKQVIMQKVREAEKEAVMSEYSNKIGQVFTAQMQRMKSGTALFEIGKATAIMPQEDQISNEFYRIGERYKVLLKAIEDPNMGDSMIVSRADPSFLVALFEMEVPEIESGIVLVKAIAREAGSRSKMAVFSTQDGVDPIGSCVGQRGTRIANVMTELGEEKIDIIEWKEDIEEFVANALSPATVISVEVTGDVAVVKVAEDQLSLAIGREGQNVRLAAKLTGLKIDIQGPKGKLTAEDKDKAFQAKKDRVAKEVKDAEEAMDVEYSAEVVAEAEEAVAPAEVEEVAVVEVAEKGKAKKSSKASSAKTTTKKASK